MLSILYPTTNQLWISLDLKRNKIWLDSWKWHCSIKGLNDVEEDPEENMVPLVSISNVFAICAIWQRFQDLNPKFCSSLFATTDSQNYPPCSNAWIGIDQPWKRICWQSLNFTEETWVLWFPSEMSSQYVQFGSDFNISTQKPSLSWFATHSNSSREEWLHWWHKVFLFYSILR